MQLMYAVIIDMMCVVKVSSSCFVQIFKEKTYHSKYIYIYIYMSIFIFHYEKYRSLTYIQYI